MHVTFHGRDRFLREYGEVLKMKGCRNPEDLVQELEEEVLRRQKLQEESWRRRQLVASQYTQLNPHIFTLQVTLNISLNEDYSDGDLYFGPLRTETSSHRIGYSHQLGHGLLHLGQQLHGALPISQGTRYNLIIWMRSSRVRNRLCPMCDQEPSLVPVKNGFGDGFTAKTVNVCSTS
ncbi:putative 2-oxoglutarate and iron-dependent oxygenase domain-containing protein 2-like [Penaeus vannamei]|uniref:Putative 2-oxoglutarate and iron-dependent oxygenase domain-containing protein 2-like n=1 Tax=Penaeus vannamei TaxID=6689 RepID=A0A423TN05_PENVA|nr:putative 2-oxoglutarate and iron-dependent oxygenase domain-containing protein 2-like [Penaeus vannamei]